MAGNTRRNWSTDDLQAAVSAVKNNKISEELKVSMVFLKVRSLFMYMAKLQSVINQDLRPFLLLPGGRWICCDHCDVWYHLKCVGLKSTDITDADWYCSNCKT